MPSSTRHRIKRKLEYVEADIINALLLLNDVYQIYFPDYPELAQKVDFMRQTLRAFIIYLTDFNNSI